jgi:ABC-2 type transport system ATP-binding protein
MKRENVLSVSHLRKIFPGHPTVTAVDGISFEMAQGEILGLLGPNGAGKTTTIQMLIGTLTFTSGSIHYFGQDFQKHRKEIMMRVVFASTYVSLPWLLTIDQNLKVFGRLAGLSRKEVEERADPLLERFGILNKKKYPVSSLSSGQITRLMLVKAFISRPDVVLLDEPTASLDPEMAQDVLSFLREERKERGISILFTSHRMDEVADLCDRVIFLHNGRIVANDRPDKLAKSVSRYKLRLQVGDDLQRSIELARKQNMAFIIDERTIEVSLDEGEIPRFLTRLAQAGVTYSTIKILEPSLEDYFLKMARSGS